MCWVQASGFLGVHPTDTLSSKGGGITDVVTVGVFGHDFCEDFLYSWPIDKSAHGGGEQER